jgi:signal transduction histidine kinase
LLQELGERLVTTPHVALAELVKNSYDADATEVHVFIREGDNGGPEIEVRDDGHGLNLHQIENYWMRIGTSHKSDNDESQKYGRPLTGSKGIGRFCVRRLGTHVKFESSATCSGGIETNSLEIDWTQFVPGQDVSEVPVIGRRGIRSEGETGLTLIMSGYDRVSWNELEDQRSYGYLLRQLAMLAVNRGASRDGYEEDPGFQIFLHAAELDGEQAEDGGDVSGVATDIRESVMHAGWALLTSSIDDAGHVVCKLDAKSPVGTRTYRSSKPLKYLTDVSLKLSIFVEADEWNRDTALMPSGKRREMLDNWGGVQVRQNGMRVDPYGNSDNDWLGLERDRARRLGKPTSEDLMNFADTLRANNSQLEPSRVLLNMLSSKSYLGAIEIGNTQGSLLQKADRQGYVEGPAFNELKKFSRFVIDWAMIWRDFAVQENERQQIEKFRHKLESNTDSGKISPAEQSDVALKVIRDGVSRFRKDASSITPAIIDNLVSATSLLESEIRISKADLQRFQLVASASTLSLLYHHEVKYISKELITLSADLDEAIEELEGPIRERLSEVKDSVITTIDSLDALGDLTEDMNALDRKAKALELDLARQTNNSISRFKRILSAYKIEVRMNIASGMLVGPMLKGELVAILLNSLSNAIKAVIAGGASSGAIEITAKSMGKSIYVFIKDNGIGLNQADMDTVFSPLVSDPNSVLYDALEERVESQDKQLLGQGSGMGLSILKGILENRKGSVRFIPPEDDWATCLQLTIPSPK